MTRAVSGQAGMSVDTLEMDVSPGDRLILCSDGVHGVLNDEEIAALSSTDGRSLDEVCRALIDEANTRGGPDNATTVVVEMMESDTR